MCLKTSYLTTNCSKTGIGIFENRYEINVRTIYTFRKIQPSVSLEKYEDKIKNIDILPLPFIFIAQTLQQIRMSPSASRFIFLGEVENTVYVVISNDTSTLKLTNSSPLLSMTAMRAIIVKGYRNHRERFRKFPRRGYLTVANVTYRNKSRIIKMVRRNYS